jgi:hypothetical protein
MFQPHNKLIAAQHASDQRDNGFLGGLLSNDAFNLG